MEGVEYLKTYGWRAAHIVYENAKLRNENQVKKLVYWGMWVIMTILVGYENNDIMLRVWEKVDWMVWHSDFEHLHRRLLPRVN